ncbi:DHA2 family efflux MFS transporter permease subunit [Virgisporangium ochraceum]|uniref:MFS transporter n=1 Tax=Virgisporangium ochraceum TaxID=65505 RepID=A0A8J3ZQX1_9ACTN|nr:DHA2 family efflux MFS transporter permease subunit [Virgisporangium ochraceum]GIJ68552.1 MFS transporter [Virgisporangium ochraceum]
MSDQGSHTNTELKHSPWLVLVVLCLGFFMILLDTTIVNVAIPAMSDDLNASLADVLWILNAYILVYAVLLITAGRLGDLYGPRRLFIVGLVVFTAASAACGFAQNPDQLIAFRVLQGVGGALLTPQTLTALTVIFPPDKRGAAFGIWGGVAGIATLAGPVLGGWLVDDFGWRWIFFVNLPVGILALVGAVIVMPDLKLNRRHRLDWVGTVLVTTALFLITFGLIEGQSHDWGEVWGPVTIVEIIVAGVVLLVVFFLHQWATRDGEPLVPYQIFRDRNFSVMNYVAAAIAFGMLGLFLPLTIFLQSVLGLTALQAGLAFAPMSLISMFIAPFAGRLADRTGGKLILFAGLSLFSLGMGILIASSHVDSTRWHLLPGLVVAGVGLGLTFAPLQTVAMRNVEPRMAGAASGIINTTRQLGGVVGSAAVGALLQAQLTDKLAAAARSQTAGLPAEQRQELLGRFGQSAGDLDIGNSAGGITFPPGTPPQVAELATRIFHTGFVDAMRVTLVLPIAVLASGALTVLLVRRRSAGSTPSESFAPEPGGPSVVPGGR